MPRTGASSGTHAWGLDTAATVSTALVVASTAALVATLGWPANFAHGLMAYLISMVFTAAAIDGIFELIGGFIWGGWARYARGAILLALALGFALLPATVPSGF